MVCYRSYYQSSTRLNATNHNAINDAALNILIADDHPLYRDALELVVNDVFPSASIVSCASQEEVLDVVGGDDNFDGRTSLLWKGFASCALAGFVSISVPR